MRLTLHLLLLLCGLLPAAAATGVQGTLVDAITGAPVADANVLLANGGQFVTSTSDGHFQMSDCTPGQDQLRIVAFGYKDMERCLFLGFTDGEKGYSSTVARNIAKIALKHGGMPLTGYVTRSW